MPIVGVSITKSVSFRGVAQEFANTYYYFTPLTVSQTTAEGLIDSIVAEERPMHSTAISFVRGRCWTAGGTNAQNNMLAQKALTGAGTNTNSASTVRDRERAFLVRFRAGVDTKGRPVYLRKWWHLDISATSSGNVISNGMEQNTLPLTTQIRADLVAMANDFKQIVAGAQNFELVAESGREIDGDTTAHPYLEHHQLGDMWRG